MIQTIKIPYGSSLIEFRLPSEMHADVVDSQSLKPIADVHAAIKEALEHSLVPSGEAGRRLFEDARCNIIFDRNCY